MGIFGGWMLLQFYVLLWPRVTAKDYLSITAIKTSGLLCKTSLILNLLAMGKFRSKLVSSGLDKHTSFDKQTR